MTTELSPPKGHGLVRVAHNLRVHVNDPRDWALVVGTDYWANFGGVGLIEAGVHDLDLNDWVTAGFSHTVGSGADFLASDDVGTTGGLNLDAADDFINSPFIFGDYAHALLVGQILGHFPTSLSMECYARFAANNNEEATGFGFVEAGSTGPFAKGDLMAWVTSDGTNFSLESGAAADAGSTDNTTAHQFKIKVTADNVGWSIDGTQQGTIALQEDLWPVAWAASTVTGGGNDPVISWVHIWYE